MRTSHETIAACGAGEHKQRALRLPRKPMHGSLRCACNKLNKTNAPSSRGDVRNHFSTRPSIVGQCTEYHDDKCPHTHKKKTRSRHVFIWSGTNACRQHRDNTIMTDYVEDEQTIPGIPCQCQIARNSRSPTNVRHFDTPEHTHPAETLPRDASNFLPFFFSFSMSMCGA